jgi:peptidoglycan/LPS O-acetylase OafA/YrhL
MSVASSAEVFTLAVTWSLAVEEQFYLTLPLLVRCVTRRRLVAVLTIGILHVPTLRLGLYLSHPDLYYSWYTLMPSRADLLLLGVLGALVVRDQSCRAWLSRQRGLQVSPIARAADGHLNFPIEGLEPYSPCYAIDYKFAPGSSPMGLSAASAEGN